MQFQNPIVPIPFPQCETRKKMLLAVSELAKLTVAGAGLRSSGYSSLEETQEVSPVRVSKIELRCHGLFGLHSKFSIS
jgi:hypothetical protein